MAPTGTASRGLPSRVTDDESYEKRKELADVYNKYYGRIVGEADLDPETRRQEWKDYADDYREYWKELRAEIDALPNAKSQGQEGSGVFRLTMQGLALVLKHCSQADKDAATLAMLGVTTKCRRSLEWECRDWKTDCACTMNPDDNLRILVTSNGDMFWRAGKMLRMGYGATSFELRVVFEIKASGRCEAT